MTEEEHFFKQDIEKRAKQLEQEQKELQKVNAKVYADFCKELGISDISEYEGGSLAELRQRAERVNNLNRVVCYVQNSRHFPSRLCCYLTC